MINISTKIKNLSFIFYSNQKKFYSILTISIFYSNSSIFLVFEFNRIYYFICLLENMQKF